MTLSDGTQMNIFVRSEGPIDGETVLLLHGVPTSSFLYRKVQLKLASEGFHVVSFDFPGNSITTLKIIIS